MARGPESKKHHVKMLVAPMRIVQTPIIILLFLFDELCLSAMKDMLEINPVNVTKWVLNSSRLFRMVVCDDVFLSLTIKSLVNSSCLTMKASESL